MTINEIKSSFSALSTNEQERVLSVLAHQLTVYARDAYEEIGEGGEGAIKLRAFNEVLHNVTGQLAAMLRNNDKRYPDDVFIDIVFETAQEGRCEDDVIQAVAFVFKYGLYNPAT